jgi:hypothetical protein
MKLLYFVVRGLKHGLTCAGCLLPGVSLLRLLLHEDREGVSALLDCKLRSRDCWLTVHSMLGYPVKLNGIVSDAIPI